MTPVIGFSDEDIDISRSFVSRRAPRVLSLFSGAGGGDEGFHRAGFDTAGFSEIDPFARSVLRYHIMLSEGYLRPILGDVRAISGGRKMRAWMCREFGDVTLVHSSSPCQDLSVAGKRAGMKGLRSSLFFRSVRIWKFLQAPHFLWENVPGALSSHGGEDFAQVLSALVGGPVAVPRVGKRAKWSSAGVVAGPDGVAAWRILDLQHFGPPQRRRRLFVFCARAGGVDPCEVLLEREGLRGDFEARSGQRQSAPAKPRGRADARRDRDTIDAFGFNWQNGGGYGAANDGLAITPNATGPLDKSTIKAVVQVGVTQVARNETDLVVIDTTQVTHPENRSNPQPGDPCHPLAAGAHPPLIINIATERFTCARCRHRFGINDQPDEETIFNVFGHQSNSVICPKCFSDGLHADALDDHDDDGEPLSPTLQGHQRQQVDGAMVPTMGRPRRLMPIECERLMGWPDDFTKYGINTKGQMYELSDAARYRICGNGIGAPMTHWIGLRLMVQLNREE